MEGEELRPTAPSPTVPVVTLYPATTDIVWSGRWAVALTTVWTPPPDCTWPLPTKEFKYPPFTRVSCAPPYWEHAGRGWMGFYSPAICPSGYTVGTTVPSTRRYYHDNPIHPDETVGICVPTSYTYEVTNWDITPRKAATSLLPFPDGETYTSEAYVFVIRWRSEDLSLFETPPIPS
ncbi:hypothetical protein VTJ04DRAFT_5639 [Mycothermus thermophilus]|uniref:uncharacterized protein n=1 Tax=Humicola insolens TaxID=85995 RepID=UPI003743BEAD